MDEGSAVSAGGRGRLAQVIASRGGKADPEAPFVIEHREALIYMLCEAAELEHGIMCQYLFAAFSLKQREDEGLSKEQLAAARRWRELIAHVATEEMLHLALVHNLLSAVGAAPHLGRPNLPAPAHHYPAGVNLMLVPFGEPALRHFMFLERPEGMALRGASGIDAPVHDAVPLMAERDIVPRLQDFATVGHLYRSIEGGIDHLAEKLGERRLFVGPPRAQATTATFSWPELVVVTDVVSAHRAIDTILEQGEGARGGWQDAHFGQFVQILDEYRQMKAADPDFDPVRPVMFATARPCEHADDVPLIGERLTSRCVDLFNVTYEVLLQTFERYFAHTEETDAQLGTLAGTTRTLMVRVLKPLGELITRLPVGREHPGMTAGPSFELFYESDYLMPHREAAWALLEERLHEAATFCGWIQDLADAPLAAELAPVATALTAAADALAAHFGEWGATSPYAAGEGELHPPDGHALAALRLRGAQLLAAASASPNTEKPVADLIALAADTHRAVVTALNGATSAGSAARRELFGYCAARLVGSVLQPLAGALAAPASADGQSNTASGADRPGAEAAPDGLDAQLWALAQRASALRSAASTHDPLTPALAEATACLHELALLSAPTDGTDTAATRLDRLREIFDQLESGIQVARNGPYLVTNAATMRNWLGDELPVRPQMALCRCGASAIKPFCDGAHVSLGFNGAKDPNRLPDRRDTYVGQRITIFDNRGTCQHSGYCSDRLTNVFHVDGDPFVTPSGGRLDEIIRAVRNCPSGALSFAIDGVEVRAQVDWNGAREPSIEVTKDGPYRMTGSIRLTDERGADMPRNAGASREHYALCRCGHSRNKPFCSGMHWYVDFKDPVPDPDRTPTLYEWCGGLPALTRMTRIFFEKYVAEDQLLAPLFANMSADHPERVAKWLGEVFGGPDRYSRDHGSSERMASRHLNLALSEEARSRWVELIFRSANEAGLPPDPEFEAAFRSYLEWGSRVVVESSQPGAKAPQMPMPRWNWVGEATPGSRPPVQTPEQVTRETSVALPADDQPVGFEEHIKPLFRERDRRSMSFAFDLWSVEDVSTYAEAILQRLDNGSMPCDGAWPPERVAVFRRWVEAGKPATVSASPVAT
jgi:CDGSH-type Zn-finger protein/truncated hemoglobin YjbI